MRRRTLLMASAATMVARVARAAPRPVLDRTFVVVLDPGHGGGTRGCQSSDHTTHEKSVTLDLAERTQRQIGEMTPGVRVLLTRVGDVDVPLSERVAIANAARADLFISIHANASPGRDQAGYETFVLDANASSDDVSRQARRGRDSSQPSRQDANLMLRELSLRTNLRRAARVAQEIQRAMAHQFPDRLDRGVRQGSFDVLRGLDMPGLLTEVGFLDHEVEGEWLQTPSSLDQVARCISEGVGAFCRWSARLR